MPFLCTICGLEHIPEDLSFGADQPDLIVQVPAQDREWRVLANSEFAVLDTELHFVRGIIVVPVHDHKYPMLFGLWAMLYPEDFAVVEKTRSSTETFQGNSSLPARIANTLQCYPHLFNARARVILQQDRRRPELLLVNEGQPLFTHQREGITLSLAIEFACQLMHTGWSTAPAGSVTQ
jgi:hypothetical protein